MRVREWTWWCAVFLSGGLLALLVCAGSRRFGHPGSPRSCRLCLRRQRVGRALAAALSLLVLTGSAMWVNQRIVSPDLPECATTIEPGAWELPWPTDPPKTRAWREARTFLTAPVTGIAYHYADTRGGGLCSADSVTVAFVPSAASDTALTVGDVFVTGLREQQARELAEHESAHVNQWAVLTLAGGPVALPVLYSLDEALFPGARNHFERAAGLVEGNYAPPAEFGPDPQWDQLAAIAAVVLLLFWRRLRWLARAAVLGRPGARHRESGRCRVHSRGWVRLHAPEPESAPGR